jgi:hypothetical protein
MQKPVLVNLGNQKIIKMNIAATPSQKEILKLRYLSKS